MEFPASAILTPYNYFDWKPRITHMLMGKGLYRIAMATETEPTSAVEKSKYFNRMDEAYGLLCMSISPDLWFHIDACKTPNEIWTTLAGLFGKQDEMRGHLLEVELNSLDPKNFDNLQDFFTKFKSLLRELKDCGIDKSKQEKQMFLLSWKNLDQI
jgi:hypothetical protein